MLSPESFGGSVERNRRCATTVGNVGLGSNRSPQLSSRLLWEAWKLIRTGEGSFVPVEALISAVLKL